MLKMPDAWPISLRSDRVQYGVLGCGHCHRNAGASDDQRSDEFGVGDVGRGDEGDPGHSGGLQEQAADNERAFADPVDERAGERGHQEQRGGPRQQPQTGAERAVALHRLQELRQE